MNQNRFWLRILADSVRHDNGKQVSKMLKENLSAVMSNRIWGRNPSSLGAALEQSQTNQMELARLRGQGVRLRQLEQENTQLKTQRQRMDRQLHEAQLPSASHDQPPLIVATDVTTATAAGFHHITRLGSLELSPGIPVTADLGGGTNCVLTPLALPDGNIETEIAMSSTNADGTISEMTTSRITSRPGQECAISVGNRMIALAVKLKAE